MSCSTPPPTLLVRRNVYVCVRVRARSDATTDLRAVDTTQRFSFKGGIGHATRGPSLPKNGTVQHSTVPAISQPFIKQAITHSSCGAFFVGGGVKNTP